MSSYIYAMCCVYTHVNSIFFSLNKWAWSTWNDDLERIKKQNEMFYYVYDNYMNTNEYIYM